MLPFHKYVVAVLDIRDIQRSSASGMGSVTELSATLKKYSFESSAPK